MFFKEFALIFQKMFRIPPSPLFMLHNCRSGHDDVPYIAAASLSLAATFSRTSAGASTSSLPACLQNSITSASFGHTKILKITSSPANVLSGNIFLISDLLSSVWLLCIGRSLKKFASVAVVRNVIVLPLPSGI